MRFKLGLLVLLLLTILSGAFSINRFNISISLEPRYILLIVYLMLTFIYVSKHKNNIKLNINNDLLFFLFSTVIYFLMIIISLYYTFDKSYGVDQAIEMLFLLILIMSVLVVCTIFQKEDLFNQISKFFIVVGVIYAIPIYISVLLGASRGEFSLSGPNVATRVIFFAVCSSIYLYTRNKRNLYLILCLIFLLAIVLLGSRGGLVGAVAIISLVYFMQTGIPKIPRNINIKYKHFVFLFTSIIILYYVYSPLKRVFVNRILGVTFNDGEIYTSGRDVIYNDAISLIKNKPLFGQGVGSFTPITGHVYPHNVLLEMMLEIGLIGALIFIVFLVYSVLLLYKWRNSNLLIFSALPLYMIIVQMFSGEFYDFRYYFLWSIPLIYYSKIVTNDEKKFKNTI